MAYADLESGPRINAFALKNNGSKKMLGHVFKNKSPIPKTNIMKNSDLIEQDDQILALSPPLGRAALRQVASSSQNFTSKSGNNGVKSHLLRGGVP